MRLAFIFFGVICIALSFTFIAAFAKDKSRKPNQTDPMPIIVKVVYGDKTTAFTVTPKADGGRVEFSNNSGAKESRDFSSKDLSFLKNKIAKLSGTPNDRSFCTRNYISIIGSGREVIGCLGAPNEFAKGTQEIANLLSVLF